jgi:hypothetical protein
VGLALLISAQKLRNLLTPFCVQAVQDTTWSFRSLSLAAVRPFTTQCEQKFYTVVIVALSLALQSGLAMQ